MSGPSQSNGHLVWQVLLSPKKIKKWAESRKAPVEVRKVKSKIDYAASMPGVYRFIFPDDHSYYIGEAQHLGTRLHCHICPNAERQSEDTAKNRTKRRVSDAIKNSIGKCSLEYLTIDGTLAICGLTLDQNSFGDPFARLLLENLAILQAEKTEKTWRSLNRKVPAAIPQSTKDLAGPAALAGNLIKPGPGGALIDRGGFKTML